jgi:hypothetical protein
MRFQHSVGLLTNNSINTNNNNNNNNSNCTDITNSGNNIYNSLFESDSNLNQTIQFTRDLNFITKPNDNSIETTLHSINGSYQNNNNNEQELINSQSISSLNTECGVDSIIDTTLLHCGESGDSSHENEALKERPTKLGTVKTQERQSQYNPFEKTRVGATSTEVSFKLIPSIVLLGTVLHKKKNIFFT